MTKHTSQVMPHKVRIKAEKATAGDLDLGSMKTALEEGIVEAIGPDVSLPIKVGDKILFKSWGVDVFNRNGENVYYIDERTLAICEKL